MADIFGNEDITDSIQESETPFVPLQDKYEVKTSVAADILGFTAATVGDFGASVWNSLPFTETVETSDLLKRVDNNALRMYEEHPDAVHAASFIGGVFVPAGLAMKGMNLARSGAKGVSWFSSAGKVEAMTEVNNILKNSTLASDTYKTAVRNLYARDIANVVVDNLAAEVAIIGTMNAHPFMEDYMKDPASNFMTSMLFGTAIVAPLSHIGMRGELKRAAQAVYEPALDTIRSVSAAVKPTDDFSTQIATHQTNLDNWNEVLRKGEAKEIELDAVTTGFLKGFISRTQAEQVETFNKMASQEVIDITKENPAFRDFVINEFSANPERFAGINSISFASAKEDTNFLKDKIGKLFDSTLIEGDIPLTKTTMSGKNAGNLRPSSMVYSQRFNAFMLSGDMKNFGVAADITTDLKGLNKSLEKNWHMTPNYTAWEDSLMSSTAKIDLDYIRKLKAVDEMDVAELNKIAVSPDDGPMLNAVLTRWEKLSQDPNTIQDALDLKITITKNLPNWDKIEKNFMSQIPMIGRNPSAGGVGVKPSYLQDLTDKVERNWDNFALGKASLSMKARSMLDGWKSSSGMSALRRAVDDAFRPSNFSGANHGATSAEKAAVKEIYDSTASTALRQELMQLADSEGNVYLYRGLKREGFGATALESYTTNAAKAAEFGTPKLYKVKVQDVLGGIRDIAGRAGHAKSTEVLVMSHTRDAIKDLPIAERALSLPNEFLDLKHFGIDLNKLKSWDKSNMKNLTVNLFEDFGSSNPLKDFKGTPEEYKAQMEAFIKSGLDSYINDVKTFEAVKTANSTDVKTAATIDDVREALLKTQMEGFKMGISQGAAAETIALRNGMTVDSVKALIGSADVSTTPVRAYTNAADVGVHLTTESRSLGLATSASKIPVAEMRAQLHSTTHADIDQQVKDLMLSSSPSKTVGSIAAFFHDFKTSTRLGLLKNELQKITPANLGSKFFSSSDFTLRDMGNAKDLIIEFGKDAAHLKTAATNDILKPISNSFASILKDQAGTVEFITAYNLNASLKGYRELRNGKFFVQDAAKPWIETNGVKVRNMVEATYQGKPFQITTPSVLESFVEIEKAGRELYDLNNAHRKILGMPALNDIGFWSPAFNIRDKHISYVFDTNTQTTRLLWGYTPGELKQAEEAFLSTLTDTAKKFTNIVRKGEDQKLYNLVAGRHDPMFMDVANVSALHSGASAQAIPSMNTGIFSDIANGYEGYIHRSVENLLELQYSDVFQHLDTLNSIAVGEKTANVGNTMQKALNITANEGNIVKNTMLAKSNLKDYTAWNQVQNGIQAGVEISLQAISKVLEPVIHPTKGFLGLGKGKEVDYIKLQEEMKLRGIVNPFEAMDNAVAQELFNTQSLSQAPNMTPKLVALSNNLAATFMLRVMELGQPLVNMMSLPVLTSAAVQKQFKPEYMGAKLSENFHLSTTAAMFDGARMLGNPAYASIRNKARELGVMNPVVSEVSELMQLTRSFNPGVTQKVENALNSNLITMLSKPADWSEKAVREFSFATGVSLAKKAYPGLSDSGVLTFARNFMDTAIGNYAASQRPTAFQGSLGVAMGLFQTYMVTLAQQIYGRLELRDYKTLSKIMLTQASIFGVKGLPGFNLVSEQIGEKFSDQNYDLTTGTYRAVGEDTADLVLYGLPSNLGPAVYTRGDIQPRIPNIAGGLQNLAAVNILKSGFDSAKTLMRATTEIGNEGATHAFAEALSVQSISRPVARLSELFTGHAVTRKGNEVAGPEEIYSAQGIAARVFATRGLREAKAREATYLNTMYGTLDKAARDEASMVVKNHIRSGTLTPEIYERAAEKYMRTGSPQGWRSMNASAIKDTDSPGVSAVRNHLSPDSPTNMMIDSMD